MPSVARQWRRSARLHAVTAACVLVPLLFARCASQPVGHAWNPVPEVAPDSSTAMRGNAIAAGALSNADQLAIVSNVLRGFYRPLAAQARWLDPRPLAHVRSAAADDTVGADPDFADDVVGATKSARYCVLGSRDDSCRGKPGGVLRFSWPYRVGTDSAVVFATYAPRDPAGQISPVQSEMQFRLTRNSGGSWIVEGKSTVTVLGAPNRGTRQPR